MINLMFEKLYLSGKKVVIKMLTITLWTSTVEDADVPAVEGNVTVK